MPEVKITCDSACDLTAELYEQFGIEMLPLGISLGEDFRRDGVDVSAQELFDYVAQSGELPKTSAVSIGEYEEKFRALTREGCEAVHISLSGELSACYQNACIAADMVGGVFVVDTKSLSLGAGYLAMHASELAREGRCAREIAAALEEEKEHLDVSFVLQSLDHLHKGGRCPGVAVLGANLMKIRPEIVMTGGKLHLGKKYRGTMEKSILDYVRGRLEGKSDICCKQLIIVHSGVPRALVDKAEALARELQPFEQVQQFFAGCTISSHAGPNCLGMLVVHK